MVPSPADMPARRPKRQRAPQYAAGRLLTSHARSRMREFDLTKDQVAEVITGFENRYVTTNRKHGTAVTYQRGAWAVIVDEVDMAPGFVSDGTIITIVRRTQERWEH